MWYPPLTNRNRQAGANPHSGFLSHMNDRTSRVNETTAANMLKTARRLFRSLLEKHVRQTVVRGEAVEEELQEVFGFLRNRRTD